MLTLLLLGSPDCLPNGEMCVFVKGDVQGTVEALMHSLFELCYGDCQGPG
jgi:hypothetical protein